MLLSLLSLGLPFDREQLLFSDCHNNANTSYRYVEMYTEYAIIVPLKWIGIKKCIIIKYVYVLSV